MAQIIVSEVSPLSQDDLKWLEGWNLRAILFGSVASFVSGLFMTVLGTAIGATRGASVIGPYDGGDTKGIAAGAVIWLFLTAIVAGVVGGSVMKSLSHRDFTYRPSLYGFLNWTGSMLLAAIIGVAGMGMTGAVAAGAAASGNMTNFSAATGLPNRERAEINPNETAPNATRPDQAYSTSDRLAATEAARRAAKTAAGVSWAVVIAELIALAATVLTAQVKGGHRERAEQRAQDPAMQGY